MISPDLRTISSSASASTSAAGCAARLAQQNSTAARSEASPVGATSLPPPRGCRPHQGTAGVLLPDPSQTRSTPAVDPTQAQHTRVQHMYNRCGRVEHGTQLFCPWSARACGAELQREVLTSEAEARPHGRDWPGSLLVAAAQRPARVLGAATQCTCSESPKALSLDPQALQAYRDTSLVSPLPRLWLAAGRRRELRTAGVRSHLRGGGRGRGAGRGAGRARRAAAGRGTGSTLRLQL